MPDLRGLSARDALKRTGGARASARASTARDSSSTSSRRWAPRSTQASQCELWLERAPRTSLAGSRGRSRDDCRAARAVGATRLTGQRSARCRSTSAAWPRAGVVYDSRKAAPGTVFVAIRGQHADGITFTPQAVARGAAVVVTEEPPRADVPAPWVQVADARLALALLADRYFGHPSGDLSVVGITGTNGKTTTAYLLRAAFEAAGHRCGLMGTVTYSLGDEEREATRTTPEAPDMQAMLREMADRSCRAAVMEVSSHALALRRVDGTRFAAGVFTNLTRDHLDFHRDMEAYAIAKRRLFEMLPARRPRRSSTPTTRAAPVFIEAARQPVTYGMRRPADVSPGHAGADARRAALRGPHAGGRRADRVAARRPAERLQHPRGGRDRRGARPAAARDRSGIAQPRRRARALRSGLGSRRRRHASSWITRTPTTR